MNQSGTRIASALKAAPRRSSSAQTYWSAVATWLRKDRRLARLASAYRGAPVDVLPVGTDFRTLLGLHALCEARHAEIGPAIG